MSSIYLEIEITEDNNTFKKLCDEYKIEYTRGCGYYKLGKKKENISKDKKLVIINNNSSSSSSSPYYINQNIRELLNLPNDKKSIKINIDDISNDNYNLFVNSTSANRKLEIGSTCLINITDIEIQPTWTNMIRRSKENTIEQKKNEEIEIVDWNKVDYMTNGEMDDLPDFINYEDFHDNEYLDEAIELAQAQELCDEIKDTLKQKFNNGEDWKLEENNGIDEEYVIEWYKYSWKDNNGKRRLEYGNFGEKVTYYIIDLSPYVACCSMISGCHPFVYSTKFNFSNSDGSTFTEGVNLTNIIDNNEKYRKVINTMLSDIVSHTTNPIH